MFSNIIWYIVVFAVIGFSFFWILFSLRDKSKRTERNGVFCTLIIIYSVFFWYFFHPFWTEKWLDIFETEGLYLRTSNFICGLIYIGGFVIKVKLWNRLYPFDWLDREGRWPISLSRQLGCHPTFGEGALLIHWCNNYSHNYCKNEMH